MTLDHHHDDDLSDTDSEDSFWAVDVDAFRWLVSDVNLAWRGLAGMYHRSLAPVYNRVQSMLVDDTVQVTHVLLDLEQRNDERSATRSRSCPPPGPPPPSPPLNHVHSDIPSRPARKRRRPTTPLRHSHGHRSLRAHSPHPLHIPSTHPSAPSILITPSAPQSRAHACVSAPPVQDGCLGNRLTLPIVAHHPHRAKVESAAMVLDSERGRRRRGVLLGRTVLGVGVGSGKKGRG